jgi:hypothetical protein
MRLWFDVLHAQVAVHSSSRQEFLNQNRGVKDTISHGVDIKISANRHLRRSNPRFERFC